MNINNLNYRPPASCSELNKQERTTGIPMEDWLRGCVYHDGRNGEVTLPTDKVIEIANYIQATRTGIDGDGMVYFPSNEESRTMTKQKFRKKPVVIEAYQTDKELEIETLEGTMHASIGDWIITGVNGEPYPCKPDIFKKTYEPVVEVKDVAATTMTRAEAVWHANHVFNLVIERCINAQNLKDAREFDEAKQIVIEALEQQPKRGKWLDDNNSFNSFYANCSECGYQMDKHEERGYHNYCPNCGARMELKK